MSELIVGPALALGCLIGIYEVGVIHRDVKVQAHKLGHSIHAFLLSMVFVFATMNVAFVFTLIPAIANIAILGNQHVFRVAIGLLAAVKVHGVSRAIKTSAGSTVGLGETWFHSLLIGGLIGGAPYLYPFIEASLPAWVKF